MRTFNRQLGAWCVCVVLLGTGSACSGTGSDSAAAVPGGAYNTPPPLVIEESDLYRLSGDWLYVHSPESGLNVIDVSVPMAPRLAHQVDVAGRAGELYLDNDVAFVLLEEASPPCKLGKEFGSLIATTSQLVAVERVTNAPEPSAPVCLPGKIIASRKIGGFVYVVTSYEPLDLTWALAIDVSEPSQPALRDTVVMEGSSSEIHVSEHAIYVAQKNAVQYPPATRIRYISLEPASGALRERGAVAVSGEPAGRFHMQAEGDTFGIVTRGEFRRGSNLHTIDFTNPDRPSVLGSLTGIAPAETLHAARFEGNRVYVVTYEPVILQTDPLWVIGLDDPRQPMILGRLEIPGWSDYVFPRGDQLVAVGRGDRGAQVAVSLFDVSDPAAPAELDRVAFGDGGAASEANADFRAVNLIDAEASGLVVVPYSNNHWKQGGQCVPEHHVQLVDLNAADLTLRGGSSSHQGRVLRTLPVGGGLYALGEHEVSALDIADRDAPQIVATLDVSYGGAADACVFPSRDASVMMWEGNDETYACHLSRGRSSGSRAPLLASLLLVGLGWARRLRARVG